MGYGPMVILPINFNSEGKRDKINNNLNYPERDEKWRFSNESKLKVQKDERTQSTQMGK